jgi:SAM-dependent methyltransferase
VIGEPVVVRPFGKYERFGAYHWREIRSNPAVHNAVLAARYQVLLRTMDRSARRVLDIGCGDATLTFELARRSDRVWGIDDALLPLRLARVEFDKRPRVRAPLLSRADACRLPFPNDTFDCVVLADVIEHISAAEAVMGEARRVLRTGGQILVTTPRRQGAEPVHEYHCREYTGTELFDLLGRSFSAVEVRVFQPAFFARLYERRILGRKPFRIAMNCCSVLGWNLLAATADLAAEARHTGLCASARKESN